MSRSFSIAAAPLALTLACATAPSTPANVARAAFAPGNVETVFGRAVRKMRAAGYRLVLCDAERGLIQTDALEFDAACGGTTCLARQAVEVKLGYRSARVIVAREIYDGAWRAWQDDGDDGVASAARTIAADLAETGSPRETLTSAASDPCAAGERELSAAWRPSAP